MARSNFSGPVVSTDGFEGVATSATTHRQWSTRPGVATQRVDINVVDGAAAGTFTLPSNVRITTIWADTPVAIPGTPTNTNLRLGSAANGAQYVSDVDLKAQAFVALTLLYAARTPATTVHFTVASSGGTASAQDGTITLYVELIAA